MSKFGIYLHIPFCQTRCGYCDFNAYAGLEALIPPYIKALRREVSIVARSSEETITANSVYFGGGTPSLLPASALEAIMKVLVDNFHLRPDVEITLEANPGNISEDYLRDLCSIGVNRLSLGMQSAIPEELALLERNHSTRDVIRAVAGARKAGFDNINLDLIFGLPGQKLSNWVRSLNLALQLNPDHLSLYGLTLEEGTPMDNWVKRGLLPKLDQDMAGDMYEYAVDFLASKGYRNYEISNWARSDGEDGEWECQHNLNYWRLGPYLGFGAGAHGYNDNLRIANEFHPRTYIRRLEDHMESEKDNLKFPCSPAMLHVETLDKDTQISEYMLMGLRLVREGVSQSDFKARFGVEIEEKFGEKINELIQYGLLEKSGTGGDRLRMTPRGCLVGNQVFLRFM